MKSIASQIKLQFDESGQPEIVLTLLSNIKDIRTGVDELKTIVGQNKRLSVEIKQHREKRSLDSNSYAWLLISKIADAITPPLSKEEVYITMLKRYGQREPDLLSVISEGVDMIYRATNNHCVEVGESELNGKTFKHLAILIGSSQYDSKQMSILIDGIVSEAKELGIETLSPDKIAEMNKQWDKKDWRG